MYDPAVVQTAYLAQDGVQSSGVLEILQKSVVLFQSFAPFTLHSELVLVTESFGLCLVFYKTLANGCCVGTQKGFVRAGAKGCSGTEKVGG